MKAFFWFVAAAILLAVFVGIWRLNNEFVADTLEAFDVEPAQGWGYWQWRESWPAVVFGMLPCVSAMVYCIAQGINALKQ
jgi:hypothetical protein